MRMERRLLSLLLCGALLFSLCPQTSIFAAVTDTAKIEVKTFIEEYDLYIYDEPGYSNIRVTSENAGDILGDGTASYDASTCTLTLDNADIAGILTYGNESKTLTINVAGDSVIESPSLNAVNLQASQTTPSPGNRVYHRDKLVIAGGGKLTINALGNYTVGISTYDNVTIDGANVEINSANSIAIALQTQNDPNQGDIDLNIINDSTVTATTNGSQTNAIWTESGGIKINNSNVTVSATSTSYPALWAATEIEITNDSDVTATGGSSNTLYSDGGITVNNSVLSVYDTSEYAYPAIYAYGDIVIENDSDIKAESKGMRGIFTDGDMTINDSTVTASGTTSEGIVAVGTLEVNNSKVTASGSTDETLLIPAIITEHLHVTASEITAYGGINLFAFNASDTIGDKNISFSITPASGKLAEYKVDDTNWDGSAAVHFNEGTASPYDAAVIFNRDELSLVNSYRYIHIGEHVHSGGNATCIAKAVCDDCGREYGYVDTNSHSFTNYVYNNNATCTANGTETATCDRCDATDTREKANSMLGHNAVKTEAKAATCTEDGNSEYWRCERCGKYFDDESLTEEIAKEATVIKAKGHEETELKNEKATTCTAEGYTGDRVCKDCGEVLQKGETVPKLAHSYKDGTCTVCGASEPDYNPAVPTGGADKDSNSPQTGDAGNPVLWLALLLASGAAAAAAAVYGNRKKRED